MIVCLDGSLPGYNFDRGFGSGERNWILQFEKFKKSLTKLSGMKMNIVEICFLLLTCMVLHTYAQEPRLVEMTLLRGAAAQGAVCLDGSLPGYNFDRGFGSGERNWILQFEGGGWCNSIESCLQRTTDNHGSSRHMNRTKVFSGILSNNASLNPDFYNWNRVKIRYCDGASFAGEGMFDNGTTKLYFRGQRIWRAIVLDLLPKGLNLADKALLGGASAGGLASFLHCDNFSSLLPKTAHVKCFSDAGFFLDMRDVNLGHTARRFYEELIDLQGVEKNLNTDCTSSRHYKKQCFFPQYALPYIKTPFFVLNTAYDVYQFRHHLVPPSADLQGHWNQCKLNLALCTPDQMNFLQGMRDQMIRDLTFFYVFSKKGGMFINSCFAHGQSETQATWLAPNSPRINNKTIAEAFGDWYFDRRVSKEVDCPYPCDSTCHNLIHAK